jgi:hypothetical protein
VTAPPRPRGRDGCVVITEGLADLLARFVEDWKRSRPSTGGRFGDGVDDRNAVSTIGAVAWLAAETRRNDPDGVGIPPDTIQNVVSRRYRTTELRVADALVTALGRPEVFHDGTLTILPNPSAPRAARDACCGSRHIGGQQHLAELVQQDLSGRTSMSIDRDDVDRRGIRAE